MEAILLSIKPEYVEEILNGSKKFEFRRRLPNRPIGKIFIYCTSPVMQIVGEAEVVESISTSPATLWEQTKESAGISRRKFLEYFKGCSKAHAYELGKIIEYEDFKKLEEFNVIQAPQSFVYISREQQSSISFAETG